MASPGSTSLRQIGSSHGPPPYWPPPQTSDRTDPYHKLWPPTPLDRASSLPNLKQKLKKKLKKINPLEFQGLPSDIGWASPFGRPSDISSVWPLWSPPGYLLSPSSAPPLALNSYWIRVWVYLGGSYWTHIEYELAIWVYLGGSYWTHIEYELAIWVYLGGSRWTHIEYEWAISYWTHIEHELDRNKKKYPCIEKGLLRDSWGTLRDS